MINEIAVLLKDVRVALPAFLEGVASALKAETRPHDFTPLIFCEYRTTPGESRASINPRVIEGTEYNRYTACCTEVEFLRRADPHPSARDTDEAGL